MWCVRIVFMTFEMVGLSTYARKDVICSLNLLLFVTWILCVVVIRIILAWESGNIIAHMLIAANQYTLLLHTFFSQTNSNKTEEVFFAKKVWEGRTKRKQP